MWAVLGGSVETKEHYASKNNNTVATARVLYPIVLAKEGIHHPLFVISHFIYIS